MSTLEDDMRMSARFSDVCKEMKIRDACCKRHMIMKLADYQKPIRCMGCNKHYTPQQMELFKTKMNQ